MMIAPGCSIINETSRKKLEPGIYMLKEQEKKRVFVDVKEDTIKMYPVAKTKTGWNADTSAFSLINMNPAQGGTWKNTKFINRSFDLDVMTILFKYRPYTKGLPNQINTNFNAAEFIGYRTDLYILSYDKTPLNKFQQRINHFAYSVGGFIGIGATQMNASVTENHVQSEYDGVVLTKGISALVGIGDITFGAAVGFDRLLDKNRKVWIYQQKPWIGFTVGLNIN